MGRRAIYGAIAVAGLLVGGALGFYGWQALDSWHACVIATADANQIALSDGRWIGSAICSVFAEIVVAALIMADNGHRQARDAVALAHQAQIVAQAAEAALQATETRARVAEAELEYARELRATIVVRPPQPSFQPVPNHSCDGPPDGAAATIVPKLSKGRGKARKSKASSAKRRQSKTVVPTMVSTGSEAIVPASVQQWFTERIVPQPGHRLKPQPTYADYCGWCERHGEVPVSLTAFGTAIRDGLPVEKFVTPSGRIFYTDVALRTPPALVATK